ncbi:hypothetical protein F2P81_015206 [Scophthalmus maximus]|uniref:Uncharacterized protein n=1 Tax=Scophthalmus maximus TaxID=52904 RepID=A0A6A4SCP3_SCOMX|nr:hypothetical protein F2P81_015206 [Scophthalmus maximus]
MPGFEISNERMKTVRHSELLALSFHISKHTPLVRHGSAIATDELTVNNGFIYSPQTTCDVRNVCTTPPSLEVTHERHLNVLWQEKKRGLSTTKHSRCEPNKQIAIERLHSKQAIDGREGDKHWTSICVLFSFCNARKTTTLNIALSICNNPHPNTQLHVQQRLRKCKFVFYGEEATDNFAAHTGSRWYCCFVTVVATLQQRNRNKTSRCDF